MIDAHFHLDFLPESKRTGLFAEALRRGVRGGLVAGVWTETSDTLVRLANGQAREGEAHGRLRFLRKGEAFSNRPPSHRPLSLPSDGTQGRPPGSPFAFEIACAHGLHPETLAHRLSAVPAPKRCEVLKEAIALFERQLDVHASLFFAVGETGFDAHSHLLAAIGPAGLEKKELLALQAIAFEACVRAAVRTGLPLIVHSRGAWGHTLKGVRSALEAGVTSVMIHCYGGPANDVASLAAQGVFLSFGGVPTWLRAVKVREAFLACPNHALLLETDAPDLPFEREDGTRPEAHEPEHLADLTERLAFFRGITPDALGRVAERNVRRFLGMPPDPALET